MINTFYCCCYCCCSVKQRVMITLTVMVDVLDVNPPASGREWNMERCLTGLSPPNMPPPPRPNMPPGGGGCLHYAEYTLPLRNLIRWYEVLEICNGRACIINWYLVRAISMRSLSTHPLCQFHPYEIYRLTVVFPYMYKHTFWYRCIRLPLFQLCV